MFKDWCDEDAIRSDERNKVLQEFEDLYMKKSEKICIAFLKDRENVPKPTFDSSIALVASICELLKENGGKRND